MSEYTKVTHGGITITAATRDDAVTATVLVANANLGYQLMVAMGANAMLRAIVQKALQNAPAFGLLKKTSLLPLAFLQKDAQKEGREVLQEEMTLTMQRLVGCLPDVIADFGSGMTQAMLVKEGLATQEETDQMLKDGQAMMEAVKRDLTGDGDVRFGDGRLN